MVLQEARVMSAVFLRFRIVESGCFAILWGVVLSLESGDGILLYDYK